MKLKFALLAICAFTILAVAAPHSWMLKTGGKIEGDYFTSGATTVVVKRDGTNCLIKISDLATNELPYLAEMQSAQRQARLDAEAKQMASAGMIELTVNLIRDFPEKVDGRANGPRSWMDAKFIKMDSSYVADPDDYLGFQVEDKNGNVFFYCRLEKEFLGANFMNGSDYTDKRPNPLVDVVMSLKRGDKVRLIGMVIPVSSAASGLFEISKIEMIESAAEKKAREDAAESPPADSK